MKKGKDMKPIIALNLKAYKESVGMGAETFCQIAAEVSLLYDVRIIVAPQHVDLRRAAEIHSDIFAQHMDPVLSGPFTGKISIEALKDAKVKGSLLNHSEYRLSEEAIAKSVELLKNAGLQSIVCSKDAAESASLAKYLPDYIAVEPPELIGSGISVSTAKPEVITQTIDAVKEVADIPVLCGAGISNGRDVKRAIELGASGVLLASAFVKAGNPKELLIEMVEALM
ncbi:MAG: triose-phosphate isomerase [Candidatus Anstonellaceae archaeon]